MFRSINYDEKDPFLCNACGFCKYAKFDISLTAKPCCAVDPIENEEDRKKVNVILYSYLSPHVMSSIIISHKLFIRVMSSPFLHIT